MKRIFILILAVLTTASFAGSISRGGASFSRGSSFSSSPARSSGMSRPSITNTPRPSYTAPTPRTNTYVPPPSPSYSAAPVYYAPSAGSTFASSFGGSFLGSMLGSSLGSSHGGGTTVVNNGGAPVAGGVAPGTTVVASGGRYGFWSFLMDLILMVLACAAVVLAYLGVRRFFARRGEAEAMDVHDLPFAPVGFFREVQRAFGMKDEAALAQHLGPDMLDQMLADLPAEPTEPQHSGISYEVCDLSPKVVTIRFEAFDKADSTLINEFWHIRNYGGTWKLAGIEPC